MTGMHYASIEVTGKDHPIIILSSTSIICFLHPFSHLDNIAGFHLPGDPYFSEKGVSGWLDSELEENY